MPAKIPPNQIALGVTNAADNMTIDGVVSQSGGGFGINKVGLGRVILPKSDTYTGLTDIKTGELRIQNGGALGASGSAPAAATIAPANNGGNGYDGLNIS